MCLAKSHGMGQQQQQRAMLTGVVYANAAAQLMKMIYVSSAHQANNTADIDSASSLYHDYVSLHFYQNRHGLACWCQFQRATRRLSQSKLCKAKGYTQKSTLLDLVAGTTSTLELNCERRESERFFSPKGFSVTFTRTQQWQTSKNLKLAFASGIFEKSSSLVLLWNNSHPFFQWEIVSTCINCIN